MSGGGVLKDWTALDPSRRDAITSAILDEVIASKLADHSHYGDSAGSSRVTVYAATSAGDRVTARFLFDHYLYCRTISGSDWAEHRIYVGRATHESAGAPAITVEVLEDRSVHLTEGESDAYDRESVIRRILGDKVAALLVDAPPAPATRSIVVVRCPRCGSTEAGATEYIFEITRMTCPACGHEALADNYEIEDDWNASVTLPADTDELPKLVSPLGAEPPPARAPSVATSEAWTAALRCPWCASSNVGEDAGRAEDHRTFLVCRRCHRGEAIDSLSAASRWKSGR